MLRTGFLTIAVALLLFAGPVQLANTAGDSMEPTISEGSLVIVYEGSTVEAGDIALFERENGDRILHRVTAQTEDGYLITRGDNNPTVDQEAGWEPVPPRRVHGEVVTVGEHPAAVPAAGAALVMIGDNWQPLLALLIALLTVQTLRKVGNDNTDNFQRDGDIFRPLLAAAIAISVILILTGGGMFPVDFVGDDSGPREYDLTETQTPFTTSVITASGSVSVDAVDRANTPPTVTASPEVEPDPVTRGEIYHFTYPATLPDSVLHGLQHIHPALAALASVLALFLPVFVAYFLLVDPRHPLREDPSDVS